MILAILAGAVQGVVEWLPVSSKTMITLIFAAGGYSLGTGYVMGLLANFGSFFAAVWYFRRDILTALGALRHPFAATDDARLLRFVVLATAATGVVGIPIYAVVKSAFSATTGAVAMAGIGIILLLTSGVNFWRERLARTAGTAAAAQGDPDASATVAAPGTGMSLVVGACQGLAALPGISRSAITVTPLLLGGSEAARALRLSFLLDVLGLLGAGVVPLFVGSGGLHAVGRVGWGPVVLMVAVAAVMSFGTISGLLRLASRLRASVVTLAIGVLTIAAALIVPR
jgi:undecaprenyl-diphosphatase